MTLIVVKVNTRILDKLRHELRGRLENVVKKTAFDIEAEGKRGSPVDTGANRSSIYTTLSDGGDSYSPAASAARSQRPGLPLQSPRSVEGDKIEARIGPSTFYGILLEFGTTTMAARPYMTPALERSREPFLAAIKAVIEEARRG